LILPKRGHTRWGGKLRPACARWAILTVTPLAGAEDFASFVERIFTSDRPAIPKGMIEVKL
jgi:hypothetical protein